jgi:hypothetical protein
MLKRLVMLMCAVAVSGVTLGAQAKPATPAPATGTTRPVLATTKPEPSAAKAASEPPALALNIRIEVSITDQTGSNPPARKVVTMIAGDHQSTNIRSSATIAVKRAPESNSTFNRDVTINVDARPLILPREPNKINVSLGLEYFPKIQGTQEVMEAGMASFSERLGLILESGKTMMISQAADPTSDRKITVEVTATILR